MQTIPLISRASALIEDADDLFDAFAADGVITAAEIAELQPARAAARQGMHRAELAYQWGMAVLKGGIDGKRAKEVENEITAFENDYPRDAA